MRGLSNILSLVATSFIKFNNTRARMLGSIYHVIKITLKYHFWRKKLNFVIMQCCYRFTIKSVR